MEGHVNMLLILACVALTCEAVNPVKLPNLPSQFSLHQELVDLDGKRLAAVREVLDYDGKLARTDLVPPPNSDLERAFGSKPVKIISDFSTGYRYVIDRWQRNCSMGPIPEHSWSATTGPGSYIAMKHSYELFDMVRTGNTYQYKGQTLLRNISVEEWTKSSAVAEESLFLLSHDWTSTPEESQSPVRDIPVGLSVYQSGSSSTRQLYHIYDFYAGHPERLTFDIEDCFSYSNQYKSLMFMLEGTYFYNVYGKHEQVYVAVTNAIAKHAKISAIRVTDVYLSQTIPMHLDVLFMLRETPSKLHNVDNPAVEPGLADAYENLKKAVDEGFSVTVPYKDGTKELNVMTSSLYDRRKIYSSSGKSDFVWYTPGAMAGLGIGMLLLGAILGVLAAFFIQKRMNTEVPYKVTE